MHACSMTASGPDNFLFAPADILRGAGAWTVGWETDVSDVSPDPWELSESLPTSSPPQAASSRTEVS